MKEIFQLFNYAGVVLTWFVTLVQNSPCEHLILQLHFVGVDGSHSNMIEKSREVKKPKCDEFLPEISGFPLLKSCKMGGKGRSQRRIW